MTRPVLRPSRLPGHAARVAGLLLALLGCGDASETAVPPPVAGRLVLDGVTVVDTRDGSLAPGMSLLAEGGKIVLRVLQMATLHGAEFLGRTSSLGRVEPGKDADLVLLDANPIESVQNLHAISAVVRSGFYRSREDLDALARNVEDGAGAH